MQAISRRSFIKSASAGAAALSASSPLIGATKQQKPNIIYMLADDMGYGDLSCFGHSTITTPHLDNLADEGVKFTDCYSAAPICSPARAGFLTGRTPNRVGMHSIIGGTYFRSKGIDDPHLSAKEKTVAECLKEAGYETCIVGKWHLTKGFDNVLKDRPPTNLPMPSDQGFDHYMCTDNNADPSHRNPKNFIRNGEPVGQFQGYSNDIIVDECIDWLENKRDQSKPFFLFVSFHSPHEPLGTPPEYEAQYDTGDEKKNIYYGNVSHLDTS
ncbi:MAG: sulfatase-like hydrolase/transferase, partial [Chitinivibrionales bacterium]|nr:sulfatase-like hydrolase/transferase [Chitinivibrionales bacterium]